MPKNLDRDINGMIFATWFDDAMNDGTEAFAQQSKNSSVIAFADADRIVEFVKKNRDEYEIEKRSGNNVFITSKVDGMQLVAKPIKQTAIKDKEMKSLVAGIDADDEAIGVMEIQATPIKECTDIVKAIMCGDKVLAEKLIEEVINEKIEGITEARYRIKVNAKGRRRRKIICKKGFKAVGNTCRRIGAAEKLKRKLGMRKALRTKKGKGAALRKRTLLKRRRAMQKRNSMGL